MNCMIKCMYAAYIYFSVTLYILNVILIKIKNVKKKINKRQVKYTILWLENLQLF